MSWASAPASSAATPGPCSTSAEPESAGAAASAAAPAPDAAAAAGAAFAAASPFARAASPAGLAPAAGLGAQPPQQRQALRLRIVRARAERGGEQHQVALAARESGAPELELAAVQQADARVRTEHIQVVTQPLAVADVVVHHQHPGRGILGLLAHRCIANRRRTRAR